MTYVTKLYPSTSENIMIRSVYYMYLSFWK